MDNILPFRVLSPGTRKPPKTATFRNKNTKLSLQSRKKTQPAMRDKENTPLIPPELFDSDLMTSDDDSSSDSMTKRSSIFSLNTQDSQYALPVAESTRFELPVLKPSYSAPQTKVVREARGEDSSSGSTEYFTACPLVGCDDSIVCLSDFKTESIKKVSSKMDKVAITNLDPVLISSDDDDDNGSTENCRKLYPDLTPLLKASSKEVMETIFLDSSDSDESISEGRKKGGCNLIIPPSPRRHSETSVDSPLSGSNSSKAKLQNDCDVVIPPSPTLYDESDTCGSENKETALGKNAAVLREETSMADVNESSWKKDFHLVMPESSVSNDDQVDNKDSTPNTRSSTKEVPSTITKEKFNDIERWLFCARESCDSSSSSNNTSPSTGQSSISNELPTCGSEVLKHPQVRRLSVVRRSSYRSESDDSFNAFMASVKKNQNEKKKKKNTIVSDGDSFINDSGLSNTEDRQSISIYHADLTKSIRAEIKAAKKTAKTMNRKHLSYSDESDECNDDRRKGSDAKSVEKPKFTSAKQMSIQLFSSDESDIEPDCRNLKKGTISSGDSESNDASRKDTDHRVLTSAERRFICRKNDILSSDDSSISSKSDKGSKEPVKTKSFDKPALSVWRKSVIRSDDSSSGSSRSSSPTPALPKAKSHRTPGTRPQMPKSIKKVIPPVTPKRVAALKSPGTPYSPIRTFLSSLSGPTKQAGARDHPEAGIYHKHFKAKKEELTRRLFKLFNREVFDLRLPSDMVLEWNPRLVRTAGTCNCKLSRSGGVSVRSAKIALSQKVITSPDRLRDTLIHEMCHAAVWLLNNVSGGHGPFWKAWASKAHKRFPELPPIERCHSYRIETKYTYKCSKCGYSFGRHSKSLDLKTKRCGYCYGTFEVFLSDKNKNMENNVLKTPKAPSAFALFVKDNYGITKQKNTNLKHGDVMKILSEKFASIKVQKS